MSAIFDRYEPLNYKNNWMIKIIQNKKKLKEFCMGKSPARVNQWLDKIYIIKGINHVK